MASATTTTLSHHHHLPLLLHSPLSIKFTKPPLSLSLSRRPLLTNPLHARFLLPPPRAYAAAPASDPNFADPDPKLAGSDPENARPRNVITWSLLCTLLMKHKLRLALAVATLFACSTCTLSMPIFSGNPLTLSLSLTEWLLIIPCISNPLVYMFGKNCYSFLRPKG